MSALLCLALLSPDVQIQGLLQRLQAPESLEAAFTQVKISHVFKTPQRAEGRITMRRPDQLRWDYTAPYRMSLIKDGAKVIMSYPDMNRVQRYDLDKDPQMKAVFETILFFSGAQLEAVRARFDVTQPAPDTLRLRPKGEGAKLLASAEVTVDLKTGAMARIKLVEPDGDEATIEFREVRVDADVPPDRFSP